MRLDKFLTEMARYGQRMDTQDYGQVMVVANGIMNNPEFDEARPTGKIFRGDATRFRIKGAPRGTFTAHTKDGFKSFKADGSVIPQEEINKLKAKSSATSKRKKASGPSTVVQNRIKLALERLEKRPSIKELQKLYSEGRDSKGDLPTTDEYHFKGGWLRNGMDMYPKYHIKWKKSDYVPMEASKASGKWITFTMLEKLKQTSLDSYDYMGTTSGPYGDLDGIDQFPARVAAKVGPMPWSDESLLYDYWHN